MSQLHELLAVEGDLQDIYKKAVEETHVNFQKQQDQYFEYHQRVEFLEEGVTPEADKHKAMGDTVPKKLGNTADTVIRYLDAVLQKERTNQIASADLNVDGRVLTHQVPATFLLGLESKLKHIRNMVYDAVPTLAPGIVWEKSANDPSGVYHQKFPEEKFRTKKVRLNHVVAPATKEHPQQTEVYSEDVRIAKVITDTWCSMISPADKARLLARIDKLIQAVKQARQRANTTEVVADHIGQVLFDFIHDGFNESV